MATMLEKELETYEAHKSELLGTDRGRFVLIKNDQVHGTFDSQMDAIRQGYRLFGNQPFLVKEIVEIEVPAHFTSSLLAL